MFPRPKGGVGSALLVTLYLLWGVLVAAEDVGFVVMIPEGSGSSEGYTPLAPALKSIFRLAAEHVARDGVLSEVGNVSLVVVESAEGSPAAANLCSAIGANDTATYAVLNTLGSSSASLIGSLSNSYLHLPILNIRGMAGRPDSRGGSGGFLLGVRPDIFPQMEALLRLILDMKLARDALDGRSEMEERVWLVHTTDSYGATAAAAFGMAASSYSVALPITEEDGVVDAISSSSNTTGGQEALRASVEIVRTTVLPASAAANFDTEMAILADDEASIIVLLADGFDPAIVRTIFTQARLHGLTEGVQWFLPDAAALDHIFNHNATYRDAALAYDMRGTLGVRTCTPLTGTGSDRAEALNQVWQRLDPDEYPGAGAESLTADDRMDPLLAFAYDSVFLGAAAVGVAREEVMMQSGANLSAIDLDRCPFPVNGSWENGSVVRDSVYTSSATLEGSTGLLTMSVGEVTDGREVDGVTFCAVNLRPHTSWGSRFEVIRMMNGASLQEEDGDGFQIISPFQEEQTYPAGSTAYPFDRPLLQGRHLDVVMRRNAPPFVFVDGDGDSNEDFTGITPSFVKTLSEMLGFTYSLRAPPEGTPTEETITMVRNGSADMAGSWITITAERSEYVSFTYPYYDLYISFVYKPAVSDSVNLWKAFAPFEANLWLTLLVALVGTVILLWLYEGAKNDQFSEGNWGRRRRNVSRGLCRSVYVTASLMMAQLTHKPETLEGYLLTLGWLFSSFVLAASYTAELASFLTATKLETTSLTVEGLRNGEIAHTNVALLQGGNTQYLYQRDFMRCTGDDCSQGPQPQSCFSTEECFDMVSNGTALTAVSDSATAEYQLQTNFCNLDILPDNLYPQHYGLVLPFDSALVKEFQKTTLELREDGTLDAEAELFLDSDSPCVSTSEAEAEESNMSVGDVSGIFVVLAFFVGLSLCSWCARRSPVAKGVRARRRRAMGPTPEETLAESFSKMSRRQQKAFALEATVKLLQDSKVKGGISSKPTGGQTILDDSPEEHQARSARRTHMREIAEGRPVVSLSGSSRSSSFRWRRLGSTRLSSWARSSRGIGGDSERGGSGNGNGSGNNVGQRGRGGAIFGMLRRRPARDETDQQSVEEHSAPVRSVATTWLAQRESSQVAGRVVCSSAPASGNVVAAIPDTARTYMMTGDDHIGEERHASVDSAAALIDMRRSLVSAPTTSAVLGVPEELVMDENQQSGDFSPDVLSPTGLDRL